ncbi:Anaphase-promoting complex, subunit CDC26 [Beauveria brongniartii RCEF 3172]|uniref:Anaphase-promoting complex, subunit CDC26 n=1 Tax=Beauveria brongniartii RCEF 3172 TaxID=1081107 RepID=A0A167C7V6_9HYPO|nr:Anaphase-promoting complex, subunit CDC26 [Beauveria brongniartii RCEF 3172]
MLRRPPTTLAITAEDVAAYEDRRAGEALLAAQQARAEAEAQAAEARARARAQAAAAVGAGNTTTTAGGGGASSRAAAMEGSSMQGASPSAAKRARDERIGLGRRPGGR